MHIWTVQCAYEVTTVSLAHLDYLHTKTHFFGNISWCIVAHNATYTFAYEDDPMAPHRLARFHNNYLIHFNLNKYTSCALSCVTDFCVLHQLSSTLHQPEPSGPGVQWLAALPLWLLRRLWTPQEIPLPQRWNIIAVLVFVCAYIFVVLFHHNGTCGMWM